MTISRKAKNIVLVVILIAAAFICGTFFQSERSKTTVTADILENRIESISELATLKYHYTNMGQFENTSTFYGYEVPFTTKRFILSYDGIIKAGVDLKNVGVEVADNEIRITLPETEILSHEIDEESLRIFDEKSSIFNKIKVEDMNNFTVDQKKKVENEAVEKGILEESRENTEKTISEILNLDPEIEKNYTIVYK